MYRVIKKNTPNPKIMLCLAISAAFAMAGCSDDAGGGTTQGIKCGETTCNVGEICTNDGCTPSDPCAVITCNPNQVCRAGTCYDIVTPDDACKGKTCGESQVCRQGKCYDLVEEDDACENKNCGADQICKKGKCYAPVDETKDEACKEAACEAGQFCHQGKCYDSEDKACKTVTCEDNQICSKGKCYSETAPDDPCSTMTCGADQICSHGKCYEAVPDDPCAGVDCKDLVCRNGACTQPDPCDDIVCGTGQLCKNAKCRDIQIDITTAPDFSITEGESGDISIVLADEPSANVTIPVSIDSNACTSSVDSIELTTENWNTPQTITITCPDNDVYTGNKDIEVGFGPFSSDDPHFNGATVPSFVVPVAENDILGLSLSPNVTSTSEAGTADTVEVTLHTRPANDVIVHISVDDATEAAVSVDQLVFTAENWNEPQAMTVTGVADHIVDGNQPYTITLTLDSDDEVFNGLTQEILGLNADIDAANFIITCDTMELSESVETPVSCSVKLSTQPAGPVTVTLLSSDEKELAIGSAPLTFDETTWDTSQSFTVSVVDDLKADGDQKVSIVAKGASEEDKDYQNLTVNSADLTVKDNDAAGIEVTETSLTIDSQTTTATIHVKLTSEPMDDMTLSIAGGEGIFSYSGDLSFDTANWNQDHEITITVTDYHAGSESLTLTATATGSKEYETDGVKDTLSVRLYAFEKQDFELENKGHGLVLYPGKYKLQVWGASGGDGFNNNQASGSHGGLGGYSEGEIELKEKTDVFVYVGGKGDHGVQSHYDANGNGIGGGFNGGGASTTWQNDGSNWGYGGGGATDIRIGQDSLYARVIVAGGGGGADNTTGPTLGGSDDGSGGVGGGMTGGLGSCDGAANYSASTHVVNQTSGYKFGQGEGARYSNDEGGGGGGWYGGFKGDHNNAGGTGGSGFIYVEASSVEDGVPVEGWLLNSSYFLKNAKTIAGNQSFEATNGETEVGHAGNGHARITLVE